MSLENTILIETKLEREKTNISLLSQNLDKYNELTKNMSSILVNFDSRLEKVENSISQVSNITKKLQTEQTNLDNVLDKLENVLEHYNSSQEVCSIIHLGPSSDNIEVFLEALDKLKRAKEYFLNNTTSVELENVTSLFNAGCDTLNNHFKNLIRRHSSPMKPIDLIDLIYIEDDSSNEEFSASSIKQLPPKTREELNIIVTWLDQNLRREYMALYSEERSDVVSRSLQLLKDHQKSGSWGNETSMKPKSYGRTSISEGGAKKKLQSIFERKANKMFQKASNATGLLKKPMNLSNDNFLNDDMYGENNDQELEKYLVLLLGLQKLLVLERQILNEIIPSSRQNEVFSNVGLASIDMIVKEAEAITSRVLKSISRKEWSAALGVFSAMKHVNLLQPDIDKICSQVQKNQLAGVMNKFNFTASRALEQFIDSIRNDGNTGLVTNTPLTSSNVPKDATVHELTSNTIWFLEHLYQYYEMIGTILCNDTTYSQPLQQLLSHKVLNPDQRNKALMGIYFRKVLTELNYTIVTKADQYYSNEATKQLFKLNNIYYILKSLQRNNLLDVVKITEVDCEKRYLKMIDDLKKSYQASWQKLLVNVYPLDELPKPVAGKLKDKERSIIKERFANFNKELEEACRNQRTISVPDVLLREGLKRDNAENLIPQYNAFFEVFADVNFSKNPEKYIKYKPHEVSAMLNKLFDDTI
ncbi:unnamed protein product [Diamesa serratosioi]